MDLILVSIVTVILAGPILLREDIAKLVNGLGEDGERQDVRLERVIIESSKSLTVLEPVIRLFSDVRGIDFMLKLITH